MVGAAPTNLPPGSMEYQNAQGQMVRKVFDSSSAPAAQQPTAPVSAGGHTFNFYANPYSQEAHDKDLADSATQIEPTATQPQSAEPVATTPPITSIGQDRALIEKSGFGDMGALNENKNPPVNTGLPSKPTQNGSDTAFGPNPVTSFVSKAWNSVVNPETIPQQPRQSLPAMAGPFAASTPSIQQQPAAQTPVRRAPTDQEKSAQRQSLRSGRMGASPTVDSNGEFKINYPGTTPAAPRPAAQATGISSRGPGVPKGNDLPTRSLFGLDNPGARADMDRLKKFGGALNRNLADAF